MATCGGCNALYASHSSEIPVSACPLNTIRQSTQSTVMRALAASCVCLRAMKACTSWPSSPRWQASSTDALSNHAQPTQAHQVKLALTGWLLLRCSRDSRRALHSLMDMCLPCPRHQCHVHDDVQGCLENLSSCNPILPVDVLLYSPHALLLAHMPSRYHMVRIRVHHETRPSSLGRGCGILHSQRNF